MIATLHRILRWLTPPRWRLCWSVRQSIRDHQAARRDLEQSVRRLDKATRARQEAAHDRPSPAQLRVG